MQEHGKPSCQRHLRLLAAAAGGDGFGPGLERGGFAAPGQQSVRGLKQQRAGQVVARFGDVTWAIDLTRLVTARRQAKVGADLPGTAKPGRIVDRRRESDRGHRSDTGHGHQASDGLMMPCDCEELPVVVLDLLDDRAPCLEHGPDQTRQAGLRGQQVAQPDFETATPSGPEHQTKGLEQAADLVLQVAPVATSIPRLASRARSRCAANGNAYRSHAFRDACAAAGVRHLRTKPYTPRTNGKAERFIQTVMRECAYARPFRSSQERAVALPRWLHAYNVHRPHTALAGKPPISRLTMNNLLGNNT
jgi:hypothetical protein